MRLTILLTLAWPAFCKPTVEMISTYLWSKMVYKVYLSRAVFLDYNNHCLDPVEPQILKG